jgi:hypothetical protein
MERYMKHIHSGCANTGSDIICWVFAMDWVWLGDRFMEKFQGSMFVADWLRLARGTTFSWENCSNLERKATYSST